MMLPIVPYPELVPIVILNIHESTSKASALNLPPLRSQKCILTFLGIGFPGRDLCSKATRVIKIVEIMGGEINKYRLCAYAVRN